ncbi:MAG: hypothetical protein ACPLRW_13320 [Moorellales bacterium]
MPTVTRPTASLAPFARSQRLSSVPLGGLPVSVEVVFRQFTRESAMNTPNNLDLATQLSKKLKLHYTLRNKNDFIAALEETGIPQEEASVIAQALEKVGREGVIELQDDAAGEGYLIESVTTSSIVPRYTAQEMRTEIERLRRELEAATTPTAQASLRRQIAELLDSVVVIKIGYRSHAELESKMTRLRTYIDIAREILRRAV